MKRLLMLTLITVPLFAFTVNFIYCDYEEDRDDEYWDEEYWEPEPYLCDDYWVWYPHGSYCVYYVWYHPWWWDWYWWHCYWCHHFDWDFFCAGFYVVWYEDGCWWFRPRYGRWVRYKLPYTYQEFRYQARNYGINLPEKPTRKINLPYKEKEIHRLVKEKDPQLYARLEKEYKSGNLEKMQKAYETRIKKEIQVKNEEYQRTKNRTDLIERERKLESKEFLNKRAKVGIDREKAKSAENETRIIKKRKVEIEDIEKGENKRTNQRWNKPKINEKNRVDYQKQRETRESLEVMPPSKKMKRSSQIPQRYRS